MWLKQFPKLKESAEMPNPTSQFMVPLHPQMKQLKEFQQKGHNDCDTLDATKAITLFSLKQNQMSKFQAHSLKISTIAGVAQHAVGESNSDSDLEADDDSERENEGNEDREIANRFEFLLRLFVNLGYYICLVPFRLVPVTLDHKAYFEIHHNTLQRVISMAQCCTASFVCFLVAYAQIGGQNIENNPLVIFNFWSYAVFCGWCFLFINIFWRKEHLILAIVNHDPQNMGKTPVNNASIGMSNRDEWIATIYFFGVVLEEIYHKTVFYLFPKTYVLQTAAEVYSGKAMYSLFVRNNSDPIPWVEITPTTFGISLWHFVGWQIFGAIKSLVYIFVTFLSLFLMGRINKEFRALKKITLGKNRHGGSSSSKQIWTHFVEVRSTLRQVNELTDLCVLGIYLILVPFLSSAFIQRWDSKFIEYKVLMILQFVWPMIALVMAAETSRLGEKFLRAVKDGFENVQRSNAPGSLQNNSAYFVYENANFSMKGGKFFKLSYGFMGATFSVVMTYGLVILGFLHDSHSKKRKC